jgi:hypothetical protein
MTVGDGTAIALIVGSIFTGLTGLLTLIFQQLNNRDTVAQRNRVEKKVDTAVIQSNSVLGETKRQNAIAARLLANQTHDPAHIKLAAEADYAYTEHMRQQSAVAAMQSEHKLPA